MNAKILLKTSGAGFWLSGVVALCVLLLVAGCAGSKPIETHPAPVYSPITITNPPGELKSASSTNSLPARRLSRRRRPQMLHEARARTEIVYEREQKLSDYDRAFVDSVQEHWYELLERSEYNETTKGKVTLAFRLLRDGSISNIEVVQATVDAEGTELCKQALLDAAPFPALPPSILSKMSKDYRKIRFEFRFD